jgi:hypothetical protein
MGFSASGRSGFVRRAFLSFVGGAAAAAVALAWSSPARAADHGDGPNAAHDQATDLADVFIYLDPNDNSQVILSATFRGFIPPGEAVNFAFFDPAVLYRFNIENTGDAKPDRFIDIRFTSQRVSTTEPQTATITLGKKQTFQGKTTLPNLSPTPAAPTVTTDEATGVQFFAGEVDDPFFFDIPAFSRFSASAKAGQPNPALLQRGRDTFAGYNIMAVALRMPAAMLRGPAGDVIGVEFVAMRASQTIGKDGEIKAKGKFRVIDRAGNPAINAVAIPTNRNNEFNIATTVDDANGRFVQDIAHALQSLGTTPSNIEILANIAVNHGDMLRLNLAKPNTGPGGGNNPEAAYPNGRRLGDDVIDILLNIISNQAGLGDGVNSNDVPFRNEFPFFAPAQQPRDPGADDNTRN